MGLYLCVFERDEELDGVDVGSYADFNRFRNAVVATEGGKPGSRYPVLILHSDCDGEWTAEECRNLERELQSVAVEFRKLPASEFGSSWQKEVAVKMGLHPQNLYESFVDVDGELLVESIMALCRLSQLRGVPILFQ